MKSGELKKAGSIDLEVIVRYSQKNLKTEKILFNRLLHNRRDVKINTKIPSFDCVGFQRVSFLLRQGSGICMFRTILHQMMT